MILTDDAQFAEESRSLRNLCFQSKRRFFHEELGFNFRLTNLQAAIGLAQLQRVDEIVAKKQWIGSEYTRRLNGIRSLQLPVQKEWARSSYWMYAVVLEETAKLEASQFAEKLKERGVETRPFFLGMHEQPVFLNRNLFVKERYPVAERIARQGLYLPSGVALTEEQLTQVCEVVGEVLS